MSMKFMGFEIDVEPKYDSIGNVLDWFTRYVKELSATLNSANVSGSGQDYVLLASALVVYFSDEYSEDFYLFVERDYPDSPVLDSINNFVRLAGKIYDLYGNVAYGVDFFDLALEALPLFPSFDDYYDDELEENVDETGQPVIDFDELHDKISNQLVKPLTMTRDALDLAYQIQDGLSDLIERED